MRFVSTMLAFCLALPLLAAGPVFAECDGVPDQTQIRGGDGATGDGPVQLRIREDQETDAVATSDPIGDHEPDKLQIHGEGDEAGHDHEPDKDQVGKPTE